MRGIVNDEHFCGRVFSTAASTIPSSQHHRWSRAYATGAKRSHRLRMACGNAGDDGPSLPKDRLSPSAT